LTPSDNERIAYLSGEAVPGLSSQERAELDELRELLSASATWEEPDPGLEGRVVSAVAEEAGTRERPRSPAPPHDGRRRRAPRRPRWVSRRPAMALAGFGAAAAAALVIVLAAGSGTPASPRFAMVITGTQLAPSTHGSAELTKTASGWRIELTATGLPHLDNGRYYQAWLKNAAGILVPVGTFNDPRNITLWSGVPVTQFRTLTVTEQRANGNPASSGRRVAIGTIRGKG
jgi:Anti-sigma-K factor rskA